MVALAGSTSHAAKAPMSEKSLNEKASHIVSGNVLEITSKVQKSTIETGIGVSRDKVYTITLEVTKVSKGADIEFGKTITIRAWQPHTRIPPRAGHQGHTPLPKKGDHATFFLSTNAKKVFEPLLPNGIAIDKKKAAAPALQK